ncbi:DUF7504 family protein [Halorussus salinisoli]|uniref:DUF7504 family protein n=1 Tax=Halorussus salinisoli TaxID=2558242 RepID=UPI0010C17820|nr:hypothetical protein [Halorussus salinisoli]
MCGEERRGSPEATARFRHRLANLKRNGCNILLVGTDALDAACERLLGESSAGPRYRLFVTTDATPAIAHSKLTSAQSGPYRDEAAVVDWQADVRGGSGTDVRDGGETDVRDHFGQPFQCVSVEGDDLRDLGETVEETIEQFDSEVGSLSPAELRLCFDSITPLVADYDDRDVRRFLLGLTETVERFDGMAHYHLPAEYDSETVDSIEALFDAVVEVQYGDEIEQRWHLTDEDITTDWLPL